MQTVTVRQRGSVRHIVMKREPVNGARYVLARAENQRRARDAAETASAWARHFADLSHGGLRRRVALARIGLK